MAKDIVKAIHSFLNGSAGGSYGLKPQHLTDTICHSVNTLGLLPAISQFVQLVLEGRTPAPWRPFFFGANLTALQKRGSQINSCWLHVVIESELMGEMGNFLTTGLRC